MGYTVDNQELLSIRKTIQAETNEWLNAIVDLSNKLVVLIETNNLQGPAADNIKAYLQNVHGLILQMIISSSQMFYGAYNGYVKDYNNNVDSDGFAVIKQDELDEINQKLKKEQNKKTDLESLLSAQLKKISDIKSIKTPNIDPIDRYQDIKKLIETTNKSISSIEAKHSKSGFTDLSKAIENCMNMINSYSKSRGSIEDFSTEQFFGDPNVVNAYNAYINLNDELNKRQKDFEIADQELTNWEIAIQKEQERRERLVLMLEVGLAVIGTTIAIIGTGGVAAIAVGACLGAAEAGAATWGKSYVSHKKIDRSELGKNIIIGGVVGGVCAGFGEGVKAVSKTATFAGSRTGRALVMGGVKASSGVVKRTAEVYGDIFSGKIQTVDEAKEKVVDDVLDPKKIAKDFILGTAGDYSKDEVEVLNTEDDTGDRIEYEDTIFTKTIDHTKETTEGVITGYTKGKEHAEAVNEYAPGEAKNNFEYQSSIQFDFVKL